MQKKLLFLKATVNVLFAVSGVKQNKVFFISRSLRSRAGSGMKQKMPWPCVGTPSILELLGILGIRMDIRL